MPFGGCGAFLVALRIIKQAYVLVGLSECSGVLQDLVESMHPPALHPDLRTYDEAGSDDATIHALPADLVLCGFPCPPQSNLNRFKTPAKAVAALSTWEQSWRYVDHHRPPVVLLENLPTCAFPLLPIASSHALHCRTPPTLLPTSSGCYRLTS